MDAEGSVQQLQSKLTVADTPITKAKDIVKECFMGKPEGAAWIVIERRFLTLDGKLPDGQKFMMTVLSLKDNLTDIVTNDKAMSVISMLKGCGDF